SLYTTLCHCVMFRSQHRPTLFPYTTLFRSIACDGQRLVIVLRVCQNCQPNLLLVGDAARLPRLFAGLREDRKQNRRQYGDNSNKDRKSTRLNSSHVAISYAVFCL